jgi:excisionase family DNA binding protein
MGRFRHSGGGRVEVQFMQNAHELIRPKEAARLAGVSTYTLTVWADAGKLRYIKTQGGQRRYYAEDFIQVDVQGVDNAPDDSAAVDR